MREQTFVQLFFAIAIPTAFVSLLIVGALIFESKAGRAGLDWARRRSRAVTRWAEILGPDLKDYPRK